MSIIKRKKRDQFFIMSNHATQQKLKSLNAIGLLAYIKSLPENWTIYKTQLQHKFTRRTVDNAWAELVEFNYIAGFSAYVDRKKQYYYIANDEPLTQEDFNEFMAETLEEIQAAGFKAKNLKVIKDCGFIIPENFTNDQNVQHAPDAGFSTTAQNVQHSECSTTSAEPAAQIQINNNKETEQINNTNINNNVNNSVNTDIKSEREKFKFYGDIIKDAFLDNGEGLFSIEEINFFADQILSELQAVPGSPVLYFNSVVNTIISRRKKKLGIVPPVEVPFYNWLDA